MLEDYDVPKEVQILFYNNMSASKISKNPVQHCRTKHIYILHYFIINLVEEKVIKLEHMAMEK